MNNEGNIIIHEGTVCLLNEPKKEGDDTYPFGFDAVKPLNRSWSFRLLRLSSGKVGLTNASLKELLEKIAPRWPAVDAKWQERIGHAVGWVTIYPPSEGEGESTPPLEGETEPGPELKMTLTPRDEPRRALPPLPTPKPRRMEVTQEPLPSPRPEPNHGIDMSF